VSLLIDGIHAWLNYTTIATADYPAALHHLIKSKNSLSWRALLQGFGSSRWVHLQDDHLHATTQQYYNDNNGKIMVTALCCTVWKKIFEVWELRNTHVHSHDTVTAAAATKKKLFTKIKLLHSRRNKALEHDRQYLIPDLQNFFQTATPTIM
jgi:hypothetical protein